ncbi:MAG: hypothetical protein RR198_01550 [Oscillospiraceae bacterium]
MTKEYNEKYYYKMLYFNAYKALQNYNFLYFSKSIIPENCKEISDYITKIEKKNFSLSFCDQIGCAQDFIMKKAMEKLSPQGNTFEIYSDLGEGERTAGVFCLKNNLFLFSSLGGKTRDCFSLNLCNCYMTKNFERQNLSYKKYLRLCESFLDLSAKYSSSTHFQVTY